jgi:hypothetical protein
MFYCIPDKNKSKSKKELPNQTIDITIPIMEPIIFSLGE